MSLESLILLADNLKSRYPDIIEKIKMLEGIPNSPYLDKMLSWGYTYNQISPIMYERVWTLDLKRPKTAPFESSRKYLEDANWKFSKNEKFLGYFLDLQNILDDYISHVSCSSVQSGLFFSSRKPNHRPCFPVHIHSTVRDPLGDFGWTMSFYFRLSKKYSPQEFLFFYESPKNMSSAEELRKQAFQVSPLPENFGCYLFRADCIPHTVIFSDDIYLWHVTNCIKLKKEFENFDSEKIYKIF